MPLFAGAILAALAAVTLKAAAPSDAPQAKQSPVLVVDALGKGAAPLDGPWQFHIGDDPSFALPQTADSTGANGWEQLSADTPWGQQGYANYTGFAWYRKHVHLTVAPGAKADLAMLIRHIDDAYEIYWNGRLMGRYGSMPPHPSFPLSSPNQTFGLGDVRDGVLPCACGKRPWSRSTRAGRRPGCGTHCRQFRGHHRGKDGERLRLDAEPAILLRHALLDGLVALLSLLAWFRNRSQRVLLWMALFTGAPIFDMFSKGCA